MADENGRNGNGSVLAEFIRKWWVLLTALVMLTGAWFGLKHEVNGKADKAEVTEIKTDVRAINNKLDDMDARLRSFFCRDQPAYCR